MLGDVGDDNGGQALRGNALVGRCLRRHVTHLPRLSLGRMQAPPEGAVLLDSLPSITACCGQVEKLGCARNRPECRGRNCKELRPRLSFGAL